MLDLVACGKLQQSRLAGGPRYHTVIHPLVIKHVLHTDDTLALLPTEYRHLLLTDVAVEETGRLAGTCDSAIG